MRWRRTAFPTVRFCVAVSLGLAYDQANVADSTIANLERYLAVTRNGRINADQWMLAPPHKRLGELYEAKGDNAKAAPHYAAFVTCGRTRMRICSRRWPRCERDWID